MLKEKKLKISFVSSTISNGTAKLSAFEPSSDTNLQQETWKIRSYDTIQRGKSNDDK